MAWNSGMFLLGAVGALAPEIVRVYEIRNDPHRFTWSWFYLIVSLLFVALGGFVAMILPAENPQGAFYAGISTPVLVNTVLKKGSGGGRKLKSIPAPVPALSPFRSFISAL
jgi:ABC-type transport system involved in cytochrome c biogenesis permease subunit